jgi:CheY-like chemotaxis protein
MGLQGTGTRLSSYYGGRAVAPDLPPLARSGVTTGLRVLVADDEAIVRTVLTSMLQRLGCTVLLAGSAWEAIKIYDSHYAGIDLVIFDLMLPDMTGEKLYDQLRLINPGCRSVLITGNCESELLPELLACGVSGILPKPFDVHELQSTVARVLDSELEEAEAA